MGGGEQTSSIHEGGSSAKKMKARPTPLTGPQTHNWIGLPSSLFFDLTLLHSDRKPQLGAPAPPPGPLARASKGPGQAPTTLAGLGLSLAFIQEHRIQGKRHHSNALPAGTFCQVRFCLEKTKGVWPARYLRPDVSSQTAVSNPLVHGNKVRLPKAETRHR